MKVSNLFLWIILESLCLSIFCIEIPIHEQRRCMIIEATYEVKFYLSQPIKVEIQFPEIPKKLPGQRYKVSLQKLVTGEIITEQFIEGQFLFRKNYKLQTNILYHICMEVIKSRSYFQPDEEIYVNFVATEDFETLIGKIEIPPELSGEENLQSIYKAAKELTSLNKNIIENQKKERELEDHLVTENVHKNQRIYTLTIVECLVIVLSGAYQVFALRRFLIDKNLY